MSRFMFVLLMLVQILSIRAYSESNLDQTDLTCLTELGYDKSVVIDSYDENDFIIEEKPEMEKFYACAWEKDNLIKDGSFDLVNLQKMIEIKLNELVPDDNEQRNKIAKNGIENCKAIKGKNDGDRCIKMYNCLNKTIMEILN